MKLGRIVSCSHARNELIQLGPDNCLDPGFDQILDFCVIPYISNGQMMYSNGSTPATPGKTTLSHTISDFVNT